MLGRTNQLWQSPLRENSLLMNLGGRASIQALHRYLRAGGGGGRQPSEQEEILPRRQMRELKKEVTMLREEI